ncbi:MAG: hypothetical protein EA400_17935 [Chromatiaceae bacterium]|nr:MAG: hypothetical protein EA400_17935 [Chromatiaceae bacterium]
MERCPNCNARWDGTDTCRRCGMDLGHLLRIEQTAERHLAAAVALWSSGDQDGAQRAAATALALQRSDLAAALAGFISSQTVVEVLMEQASQDTGGGRGRRWLPWGRAAEDVEETLPFNDPDADVDSGNGSRRGRGGRF